MLPRIERPLSCEKVALKFDQPWDITGNIAERWWLGTLNENGRVILDMPVELEGGDHHSVVVQPRYAGENLANLEHSPQIIVNQKIETAGGELFLIGSIRQARISKTLQANDSGPLAHTS